MTQWREADVQPHPDLESKDISPLFLAEQINEGHGKEESDGNTETDLKHTLRYLNTRSEVRSVRIS